MKCKKDKDTEGSAIRWRSYIYGLRMLVLLPVLESVLAGTDRPSLTFKPQTLARTGFGDGTILVAKESTSLWPRQLTLIYQYDHKPTDISSEHSLRTCTQVRRCVRMQKKKNATEVTVSGIHDLTLRSGAFIAARGPPMCSPLFLPKESSHKFAVVFCKRNAFFEGRKGARSFRIKKHANRPFRVRLCDCEVSDSFVGNARTSTTSGTASNLWSSHACT